MELCSAEAPHIVIVGGGITGLAAAHALSHHVPDARVTVLEASDRLGGKLYTEHQAGLLFEAGPDAFLAHKPAAQQLIGALGLADQLIPTAALPHPTAVLSQGRPVTVPNGMFLAIPTDVGAWLGAPLMSLRGRLRVLLDAVLPSGAPHGDEPLAALIRRRFGTEALNALAEPLMAGIYSGDPEQQSVQATFAQVAALERTHGSLIRGARRARRNRPAGSPFLTLRGGLGTLITALAQQVRADVRLGAVVTSLRHTGLSYELTLQHGELLSADAVVLALPPAPAARLAASTLPALADALTPFRSLGTATVLLAYRAADVKLPLEGFGLVVPAAAKRAINAVTVMSRKFEGRAPADMLLLRVFVGGHRSPEALRLDDAALLALVQQELAATLGVRATPHITRIFRWEQGSPQYDVGHATRLATADAACPPGLWLAGGAYRGIGIPDCITDGQRAAAQAASFVGAERWKQGDKETRRPATWAH